MGLDKERAAPMVSSDLSPFFKTGWNSGIFFVASIKLLKASQASRSPPNIAIGILIAVISKSTAAPPRPSIAQVKSPLRNQIEHKVQI